MDLCLPQLGDDLLSCVPLPLASSLSPFSRTCTDSLTLCSVRFLGGRSGVVVPFVFEGPRRALRSDRSRLTRTNTKPTIRRRGDLRARDLLVVTQQDRQGLPSPRQSVSARIIQLLESHMRVVVCVKRVLDPEAVNGYALWGRLAVDESGLAFEAAGDLPSIINAYDEQALEAALRLRDTGVDCQISVVAVGSDENADILRRCVAMGADEAILVQDQNRGVDGFRTARVLSGLIESIGDVGPGALRSPGIRL